MMTEENTVTETTTVQIEWTQEQLESMIATYQATIDEYTAYRNEKQALLNQLLA